MLLRSSHFSNEEVFQTWSQLREVPSNMVGNVKLEACITACGPFYRIALCFFSVSIRNARRFRVGVRFKLLFVHIEICTHISLTSCSDWGTNKTQQLATRRDWTCSSWAKLRDLAWKSEGVKKTNHIPHECETRNKGSWFSPTSSGTLLGKWAAL